MSTKNKSPSRYRSFIKSDVCLALQCSVMCPLSTCTAIRQDMKLMMTNLKFRRKLSQPWAFDTILIDVDWTQNWIWTRDWEFGLRLVNWRMHIISDLTLFCTQSLFLLFNFVILNRTYNSTRGCSYILFVQMYLVVQLTNKKTVFTCLEWKVSSLLFIVSSIHGKYLIYSWPRGLRWRQPYQ